MAIVTEALNMADNDFRNDAIDRLARIETKIDRFAESDKDHEKRLRLLEKWRWAHSVPILILLALAAKIGLPIGEH